MVARADLADRPGFESRLYLVEYPPRAQADVHAYTEQCVGFVLEGRFAFAFGEQPLTRKQAGEAFVDLPAQPQRSKNLDRERPLRFLLAGTFRKDEPLFRTALGSADFDTSAALSRSDVGPVSLEGPVTEVKRTLLAQRPIDDFPGLESRLYLIEFPPGAGSPLHIHSAEGVGYVLQGRFESSFGPGPTTVTRAGEAFVDLANQPHHFKNADSDHPLRFVVTGTFHTDEPLFQVVPAN